MVLCPHFLLLVTTTTITTIPATIQTTMITIVFADGRSTLSRALSSLRRGAHTQGSIAQVPIILIIIITLILIMMMTYNNQIEEHDGDQYEHDPATFLILSLTSNMLFREQRRVGTLLTGQESSIRFSSPFFPPSSFPQTCFRFRNT